MSVIPMTGAEKRQSTPSTMSPVVNSPNLKVMFPIFILTRFLEFSFFVCSSSADYGTEHENHEQKKDDNRYRQLRITHGFSFRIALPIVLF